MVYASSDTCSFWGLESLFFSELFAVSHSPSWMTLATIVQWDKVFKRRWPWKKRRHWNFLSTTGWKDEGIASGRRSGGYLQGWDFSSWEPVFRPFVNHKKISWTWFIMIYCSRPTFWCKIMICALCPVDFPGPWPLMLMAKPPSGLPWILSSVCWHLCACLYRATSARKLERRQGYQDVGVIQLVVLHLITVPKF